MWKSGFKQHGFIIASDSHAITLSLSLVLDVYWENGKKREIVWFLSFPVWTKSYKHTDWASENLVNLPWNHPVSLRMTCLNLVLYKQAKACAHTYTLTHIQTFKLFSRVYLTFESDQKLPRQIVSLGPVAKAVPNNLLWSENDSQREAHLLRWELFVL